MALSLHSSLLFSSMPIKNLPKLKTPKPYLHLNKRHTISAVHSEVASATPTVVLSTVNLPTPYLPLSTAELAMDRVPDGEEKGFHIMPRTKIVCTIGPATCGFDDLEALAVGGMNVARINMCHGTREWHRAVVERVRRLNEKGFVVAIMMDTEGNEIHMGDLDGATSSAKAEVH